MKYTEEELDKLIKKSESDRAEFLRKYRNTLVLDDFNIHRVVGITRQHEEDLYWITVMKHNELHLSLISCVGDFIPLKGLIPDENYNQINTTWNLNGGSVEECIKIAEDEGLIIS